MARRSRQPDAIILSQSIPSEPASGLLALMGQRRFAPLFWVQSLGAFNDQVFKTGLLTLLTFRLADELGLNAGSSKAVKSS